MPVFKFTAINKEHKKVVSKIEAVDEVSAAHEISGQGFVIIDLVRVKKSSDSLSFMALLNRVTKKDLVIFSRQFSVMLKATVPIVQSLRILVKQTKNIKLKEILSDVANEVDGGMKLSQALAAHSKVFSNFFVAMIRSGETSGRLDEVLEYLADQQEKDYDLMSKIKGAMIYPVFIICGLIVVGAIMMVVVIPKLTDVLKETGGELPATTKILIATSDFSASYWWIILIILIGIGVFFKYALGTSSGKTYWDWFLVKMPIFGQLFQRIYLVRFSRSLATLSSGGISLIEALKITSQIVDNKVYSNVLDKTVQEVQEGNTIASVFLTSKEIPSMVSYMVSVGEQTGKLDLVLEKISDFYSREIDNLITNLVSLIEPLIMVILGLAVGVMVAAIIMPMYNMAAAF